MRRYDGIAFTNRNRETYRQLVPKIDPVITPMKSIFIPELNRNVSRLGIGSIKFNTDFANETASLLDAYQVAGGNLIDTAEIYGRGKSEQAIGQYLKLRAARKDWTILTKACVDIDLVRPDYIRSAVPRSLERLQTEYIDLFVLHRDDPSVPVGEIVDVLNELVQAGLIRAFGGSNWTIARLGEAKCYAEKNRLMGPCLSSPHLGLATPNEPTWAGCTHATIADLDWYAEQGMPVFGWSAQCRGFFSAESGPANTSNPEQVRVYHSKKNFEKLARARELAFKRRVEPVQIALAWVLNQRATTVALVGPNSVKELQIAVGGVDITLNSDEMAFLEP
jgi:aryl-alcohol dehydrogenase-like predicted oxidoreductase